MTLIGTSPFWDVCCQYCCAIRIKTPGHLLVQWRTFPYRLVWTNVPLFFSLCASWGKGRDLWNWSTIWTLMSTWKPFVGNATSHRDTKCPGCLYSHSARLVSAPFPDPRQSQLCCLQGAQMMSRPKFRRPCSQRSFWSPMSWNIFISNLLF